MIDNFNILPTIVKNMYSPSVVNDRPIYKHDKIVFVGIAGTCGYSILAKDTVLSLRKEGYLVNYLPYGNENVEHDKGFYDEIYTDQFDEAESTCYIINTPPFIFETLHRDFLSERVKNKAVYGFPLWESEYVHPDYIRQINQYCTGLIVCSEWNKTTFLECGVTRNIEVKKYTPRLPEKITGRLESIKFVESNSELYGKTNCLQSSLNYYSIGQWTQRKGVTETIEYFCESFQSNENVALILKTNYLHHTEFDINTCHDRIKSIVAKYPNCPPIYLITKQLSNTELYNIHSAGDVYLSMTKSEGIGLGALAAANYKKQVIITGHGAQKEYLNQFEGIHFVEYKLHPAKDDLNFGMDLDNQFWAHPDKDGAITAIKTTYKSRVEKKEVSIMNNIVYLGRGWYAKEKNENGLVYRWTSIASEIFVDNKDGWETLNITTTNQYTDKAIVFLVKQKNKHEYESVHEQQYSIGQLVNVTISLDNVEEIKIVSDCFCPSEVNLSEDKRKLSLYINEFVFGRNANSYVNQLSDIKDMPLDIINPKILVDKTDAYFQMHNTTPFEATVNDVTVLITCHGDRVNFGKRAYSSVLESGIKNVVLVVSGNNQEYIDWAVSLNDEQKKSVVIISENKSNNVCWIEGLRVINTKWSIILHDDDILTKNITDELSYLNETHSFGIWNGVVEITQSDQIGENKTIDLCVRRGTYSTKVVRDLIQKYPLTISPIHGVFPTKKLIECLSKWETEFGNNTEFYKRPTFVVGNDIFIWLYFTENKNDVCFITPTVCSKCVAHTESATVVDLNLENSFKQIYSKVKDFYIKKTITNGMILYLPDLSKKHLMCLDNLRDYHMSQYNVPVVVYSDTELDIPSKYNVKFVKIDKIPDMNAGIHERSNKYSFWSFVDGLKIARDLGWDYFFGYEWDCKVGSDYWYDTLWQEHLSWPYDPIVTGTPVMKCPSLCSGNMMMGTTDYRYNYAKQCKVDMLVEDISDFAIYTNGALTFYNTDKTIGYFSSEVNGLITDKSNHVNQTGPWDYCLGVRIMKDLKENAFKHVGWLPSSYSGCSDNFYSQDQRNYMLKSKMKVAIHQYKYSN